MHSILNSYFLLTCQCLGSKRIAIPVIIFGMEVRRSYYFLPSGEKGKTIIISFSGFLFIIINKGYNRHFFKGLFYNFFDFSRLLRFNFGELKDGKRE